MPKIRILIQKDGKVIIDAEGFIGGKCLEETKKLEELLKGYGINLNVQERHLKQEYYVKEKEAITG